MGSASGGMSEKGRNPQTYWKECGTACLGLGDTNYDKFCHVGKVLDGRFAEVGADRFYELGCADEAMGLEHAVDPWVNGLWPALFGLGLIGDGSVREKVDLGSEVPVASCCSTDHAGLLLRGFDVDKFLRENPRGLDEAQLPKLREASSPEVSVQKTTAARAPSRPRGPSRRPWSGLQY